MLGTELDTELGTEPETELGTEPETELGTEPETELGTELEMGMELGMKLETELHLRANRLVIGPLRWTTAASSPVRLRRWMRSSRAVRSIRPPTFGATG